VLNNPLKYTDPTGFFTEEAIAGYYGVDNVEDISWWDDPDHADFQQMLLEAQAGDVLFASDTLSLGDEFFFTFAGRGRERLDGIYSSDGNGNSRRCYYCGDGITLDDLAKGSFPHTGGGRTRRRGIQWYGFIRWSGNHPQIYVPEGYTFAGGEYTELQRGTITVMYGVIGFAAGLLIPVSEATIVPAAVGSGAAGYALPTWHFEAFNMQPGDITIYIYKDTSLGYLGHYNAPIALYFRKSGDGYVAR
jgi:hypothetical protein